MDNLLRLRIEFTSENHLTDFPTHFWVTVNKVRTTKILHVIKKIWQVVKRPKSQIDLYYQDYYLPKDESALILEDGAVVIAKESTSQQHSQVLENSHSSTTSTTSVVQIESPKKFLSKSQKKKMKKALMQENGNFTTSTLEKEVSISNDHVEDVPLLELPKKKRKHKPLDAHLSKSPEKEASVSNDHVEDIPLLEWLKKKRKALDADVSESQEKVKEASISDNHNKLVDSTLNEDVPSGIQVKDKCKRKLFDADVNESLEEESNSKSPHSVTDAPQVVSPTADLLEDRKPRRKRKRNRSHKKAKPNPPFTIDLNSIVPPKPSLRIEDPPTHHHGEVMSRAPAPVEGPEKLADNDDKDYSNFPGLREPPRAGDMIAFKILELSEDFCPEISGYKEALVLDYNSSSQILTVDIKKGASKALTESGAWEMVETETEASLLWNTLLEPKLISTTVT